MSSQIYVTSHSLNLIWDEFALHLSLSLYIYLCRHVCSMQGPSIYPMDQWISTSTDAISMHIAYICQEWFWHLFRNQPPPRCQRGGTGILQPHGPTHGYDGSWPFSCNSCPGSPTTHNPCIPHLLTNQISRWVIGDAFPPPHPIHSSHKS